MRLAAAAVLVAAATTTASAQPGVTPPSSPTWAPPPPSQQPYAPAPYTAPYAAPAPYARPVEVKPLKDPKTATWLSIGATALGIGMFAAAADRDNEDLGWASIAVTLVGPSAGHIYAGEGGHALKMSLLRAAGFATFVYGALEDSSYECYDSYCENNDDGETAMWIGGAVVVGATLYDLYDAGRAAKRTNAKHQVMVAPTMMSAAGGVTPGVALGGSF